MNTYKMDTYDNNGKFHSLDGKPAVIWKDGTKQWYKNGRLHREGGPAFISADGAKTWYKNGKLFIPEELKEDERLKEESDRENSYNKMGLLHSFNDEPAIYVIDGSKMWYKNGAIHRDNDKPAIEYISGQKMWYKNGKKHRDNDMPAIVYANGNKQWYKHGKEYSPEEVKVVKENNSAHYRKHPSGIECKDIVKHFPFPEGNVIKHIWRAGLKTNEKLEALKKARDYIDMAIELEESKNQF